MIKRIILLATALMLSACSTLEPKATELTKSDTHKVWVFAQFNVAEENDGMESYYYYAQVNHSLYQKISQNQLNSGFILLENVRFWGSDDIIHDYKDLENTGELLFRIEDIAKIDRVNKEPKVGIGYEQFEQ